MMEQRGFISAKRGACKIFTPKQVGEKAEVKNQRVYVGFMGLEKAYERLTWRLYGGDRECTT